MGCKRNSAATQVLRCGRGRRGKIKISVISLRKPLSTQYDWSMQNVRPLPPMKTEGVFCDEGMPVSVWPASCLETELLCVWGLQYEVDLVLLLACMVNMLCRCTRVVSASWRGATVGSTSRPSLSLLLAGTPSNGAEAQRTTSGGASHGGASALHGQPKAGLSTAAAAPKLVYAAPREEGRDVVKTPPMEDADTGPAIREMRTQLRPANEQGSRGARKLRKGKR